MMEEVGHREKSPSKDIRDKNVCVPVNNSINTSDTSSHPGKSQDGEDPSKASVHPEEDDCNNTCATKQDPEVDETALTEPGHIKDENPLPNRVEIQGSDESTTCSVDKELGEETDLVSPNKDLDIAQDNEERSQSEYGGGTDVSVQTDKQAAKTPVNNSISTSDTSSHPVKSQNGEDPSKDSMDPQEDECSNTSATKQIPEVDKTAITESVHMSNEKPLSNAVEIHGGDESTTCSVDKELGEETDLVSPNKDLVIAQDNEESSQSEYGGGTCVSVPTDKLAAEIPVNNNINTNDISSHPVKSQDGEDPSKASVHPEENDCNNTCATKQDPEVDKTALTEPVHMKDENPLPNRVEIQGSDESTTCSVDKELDIAQDNEERSPSEYGGGTDVSVPTDKQAAEIPVDNSINTSDTSSHPVESHDEDPSTALVHPEEDDYNNTCATKQDPEDDKTALTESVQMRDENPLPNPVEIHGRDESTMCSVDKELGEETDLFSPKKDLDIAQDNEGRPQSENGGGTNVSVPTYEIRATDSICINDTSSHSVKLQDDEDPSKDPEDPEDDNGNNTSVKKLDLEGNETATTDSGVGITAEDILPDKVVIQSSEDSTTCSVEKKNIEADDCDSLNKHQPITMSMQTMKRAVSVSEDETVRDSSQTTNFKASKSDDLSTEQETCVKASEITDSREKMRVMKDTDEDRKKDISDLSSCEISHSTCEGEDTVKCGDINKNTEGEQAVPNIDNCLSKESVTCEEVVANDVSECLDDIVTRITESDVLQSKAFEKEVEQDPALCETATPMVFEMNIVENPQNTCLNERSESEPFGTSRLESDCDEACEDEEIESVSGCSGPLREEHLDEDDNSSQICTTQAFDTSHLETELESKDASPDLENKNVSTEGHDNANSDEKLLPPSDCNPGMADESKLNSPPRTKCLSSKVSDTGISYSPGFILSSPYTQTVEEYDALGHASSGSPKGNQDTGGKKTGSKEDSANGSKDGHDEANPEPGDEDDGKNSEEDEYGVASKETKTLKNDKAKSPEKGNVFIGYSKRKGKFKCFLCDETGTGTSFEEHVMQHILWKPYKCLYCDRHQYFITRSDIGKHVADAHKGKLPKCGLRAIRKAKEYMESAQKDGTFTNLNPKLNDMYWSCKQKVTETAAEKIKEPLNTNDSEGCPEEPVSAKADITTSDGANGSVESETIVENAENVKTSDEKERSEESEIIEKSSLKETVTTEEDTLKANSSQSLKDRSAATLKEPNVIQPRSQDFVTQLTKPQINELIALYHEESEDTIRSTEAQPLRDESIIKDVPVELIEVPVSQGAMSLASVDCQKKADPPKIQNATPVTTVTIPVSQNEQALEPNPDSVVTAVSTSSQQVASCPTVLHVLDPAAIGPVQIPQQSKSTGSQCVVKGQVPPKIAPKMIFPAVTPLFLHPNSNQLTSTNLIPLQPNPPDIQKNSGNTQSVFTIPNVSQVLNPVGMNPVSMPLNIPTSSILTIIPSQQFVSTSSKVLTTQTNPVPVQGQNTSCKLIFVPSVPVSSNTQLQNLAESKPQPLKDIAPRRKSSETQSTSRSCPPNILSKPQTHTNLPPVVEKPSQSPDLTKSALSSEKRLFPQRFSVGLVHDDFVCVPCKARFKHETSFRAHLWNHLHVERKPCAMCISSVNASGRKTLACAKTEDYLEKLKSCKIGSTSYVDVVLPPPEKASNVVQKQADLNFTSKALCPSSQSVSPVSSLSHEKTWTKLTIPPRSTSMSHGEKEKQDLPRVSSSAATFNSETSPTYCNTESDATITRTLSPSSKDSAPVNRESRPTVSHEKSHVISDRTESSYGDHPPVNRDTAASVFKEAGPVNRDAATAAEQSSSAQQETLPVNREKTESVSKELTKKSAKWQFYVCGSDCGYSSLFGNELRRHLEKCKNHKSLSCSHCQYYADSPDGLIRHLSKHYLAHTPGIAVHSCFVTKCQFATNILQGYYQHVINTHPDLLNFDCSNCKESFPDVKSLMDHLQANLLHVVNCRHCNAKDLVKSVIMSHIMLSHPDKSRMANMVKQLLCKDRKENREIVKHLPVPVTSKDKSLPDSEEDVNESFDLEIDQAASPAAVYNANNAENPVPSADPVHECCICSYVGENKQDVDTHTSKHAENPAVRTLAFSCPECPEEFNLLNNFQMHLRKHGKTLSYDICSCQICKMKKGSRDNVEEHIKAMHNMVIGDGKEFVDIKLKVSNSDVVKCKVCTYKCLGKVNLEKHNQKHHMTAIAKGVSVPSKKGRNEMDSDYVPSVQRKTSDSSEHCAGTSETADKIRMHIPSGNVFINPAKCVKCNFSSVYKGNIQRHLNQFHPDVELVVKQGKVNSPGKVMMQPSFDIDDETDDSLKIGGRFLDNELEWLYENHGTTFKCMMCSKDIQRKNFLHNHLLEHLGIPLWKCILCDKKTSRRVVAVDHVKDVHHGQCDTDIIIPLVDEIKTEVENRLGKLLDGDKVAKNIRPSLGTKELDIELKSKYRVIGKKKICKTCDAEYQSSYAVHSHILRRHLKLFMFKCSHCDFSAVDRYSVAKHAKEIHPDLELVVKYDPSVTKGKDQKKDKHSGKRNSSSEKQSPSEPRQNVPAESEGTVPLSDVVSKPGAADSFTDNTVTSISDSVHSSSGKTLHPHDSDTKNELRVGSDHLDQKLRTMYDVKPGRERILVCNTCHTEHYSKYTLHCDLLAHLKVNLVACPYCTFESIENKQLTEHINTSHPDQRAYFLFLEVSIEDATKKYANMFGSRQKPVKKQRSPKPKTPQLSQLLGGLKFKSPIKNRKSPENVSKNVISVTTGGFKKFKCKLCDYMALTKNSVGTHVFKVHENSGKTSTKTVPQKSSVPEKLSCSLCQFKSSLPEVLRNHYKDKHPKEDFHNYHTSDDRNRDYESDHVKSRNSEERRKHKSGSKEDKANTEKHTHSKTSNQPSLKQKCDKQDNDVSVMPLKKPEIILERLEDEVGTDISESVKLKKRKEKDKKDQTLDEPPTKKMKTNVDVVTYQCPKCDFKDESKENAVSHLKIEHGATKLMQCAYCTASYLYEDKLRSHIKFLHKGKDVNYQLLPLESMLKEEHASEDASGNISGKSTEPKKSSGHKNSEKNQKSGHSSKHTKVDSKKVHSSLEPVKCSAEQEEKSKSKHSKDSSKHSSKSSTFESGQEGKSGQNHSKTSSKPSLAKEKGNTSTKTVSSESSKSSSEPVNAKAKPSSKDLLKRTEKDKATAEMPVTSGSKLSTTTSQNLKKSISNSLSKDKPGETKGSKSKKKSMTTQLPPYVPSSPDNSDDEKGDCYKYLCVYCDFKVNRRSVMKLHLADHSIQRLYKGKLPELEEAKTRIRNKVRDIMPICKERARNKQEKILNDKRDEGTTDKCDEGTANTCDSGTADKSDAGITDKSDKVTTKEMPEVELKEEKMTPKKRMAAASVSEQTGRDNSSNEDSDAESEIGRPKKMRRIKRVLSSSEDESDAEVKSRPKKHSSSPSGGQLTYCCHLCSYKGKSLYRFRSHLASHGTFKYLNADMSNASNLKCGFCGFLADDKEGFSQHVEKHLDGRIYKCGYCKYDSYHRKSMRSHLKNNHRHKTEKIIDLRQVLKERAQRPSQISQLVNLDPELCLVDSLKSGDVPRLVEEACGIKGVLDMPIHMVSLIPGHGKIGDIYLDSSDDDYDIESAEESDDEKDRHDDDDDDGVKIGDDDVDNDDDDVIFVQ